MTRDYREGYQAGYADGQADARRGINKTIPTDDVLNLPIQYLHLGTRAYNCLIFSGHHRIGDIVNLNEDMIRAIRSLGKKTADEIAWALIQLSITHTEWNKFLLTDHTDAL